MSLLVTGSRSITDHRLVAYALEQVAQTLVIARLIHGGARGVDQLAGAWATARNIPVTVVRPDSVGGAAFLSRDRRMVDMATTVVAIWDGESRGTRYTLEYARAQKKLDSVWLEAHMREELGLEHEE